MSVGTQAYFLPDQFPIHGKERSWERSQSVVPIGLLVKPFHLVINCPYLISCCCILGTRSRKGRSHYSAQCSDISKLYIGVVFKILVCVPKLLRYVKVNGRQLRVRFTKGFSLSGKIKNTKKGSSLRFLLAVSGLQLDYAVKRIPCLKSLLVFCISSGKWQLPDVLDLIIDYIFVVCQWRSYITYLKPLSWDSNQCRLLWWGVRQFQGTSQQASHLNCLFRAMYASKLNNAKVPSLAFRPTGTLW